MEVADSSLAHDRTHKATVYAQAGIRDYWIWNLVDRSLEVYRDPHTTSTGEALYQTKLTFRHGTSVRRWHSLISKLWLTTFCRRPPTKPEADEPEEFLLLFGDVIVYD